MRIFNFATSISIVLFTATSSFASIETDAPDRSRRNSNYNLICERGRTQTLINTFHFQVAIRSSHKPGQLHTFETLLVEPINGCSKCLIITARSEANYNDVYLFELDEEKSDLILTTYLIHEDRSQVLIAPPTSCAVNPDFVIKK